MPATDTTTAPEAVVAVARRYRRRERLSTVAFALAVGFPAAASVFVLPFVEFLVVAVAALIVLRVPVFRTRGTVRLATDADPATVRDAFIGHCPPPLALQCGMSETVERTDTGWAWDLSYLLGLRSVRMRVRPETTDDSLVLQVTADKQAWGTYRVEIEAQDDGALVTVTAESDRRFGIRRLPQWFLGQWYRAAAYEAQGYTIRERDAGLSL